MGHFDCGEAVLGRVAHWILDVGVVPDADAGVAPPIETLTDVVAIAEADVLLENGRAGPKDQFDGPFHAVDAIDVANGNAGAAVAVFRVRKIDGRHRHPIVRNGKVELDAECGPGAAITDLCFFERLIGVEHRLAVDFIDAGVDVAADVGQDGTFQVFVFEIDGAEVVLAAFAGEFFAQRVGIVEARGGLLIERRIRIGIALFGDGKGERAFPDADLSACGNRGEKQDETDTRQ